MGWSWTWWIFSARMWAIARRPTTKTRCAALWVFWGRGCLTQEPDTNSKFAPEMDGWNTIVTIISFWGKWPIFRGYVSFRELYLHLVWTKKHWFIVHRPFWPSLKRGWDLFVANVTHEKSGLNLFVWVVVKLTEPEQQKNTIYRCLFVEILTKKRCEIWWVLIPCSGVAFWRFQFGNGKTRLLLGMFRREGQWSPGPKNGSTNKIHHVCGPFLAPSFLSQLAICKSIIATWFLYPVSFKNHPTDLWCFAANSHSWHAGTSPPRWILNSGFVRLIYLLSIRLSQRGRYQASNYTEDMLVKYR